MYYSLIEASKITNLKVNYLRDLIREGKLPYLQGKRSIKVSDKALDSIVQNEKINVNTQEEK